MATEMEFGLLGQLTVRAGGIPVPVPQGKQRILLAALLLNADRVLSLDELADALWEGDSLPAKWRVTLQNYVRRLRRAFGDDGTRIVTHSNGYAIAVSTAELDLAQFKAGLSASQVAARDGSWETAALQARAALSLWRGAPLADVGSDQLRERHEPQLEDIRLQLLETRIDAELRLGYDAQLIGELRQLTREHPVREHLRAQLMLALYRDGRQAEALAAYADAREVLVEQLGADPGPELRDLHQRMLAADPALILSAAGATTAGTGANGMAEKSPGRAPSPYRGLAAFSEADAELFFGRENAAAQVLDRLSTALAETGIVVVSGVSGAGKSSLLRAGVLPQLRHFGLAAAPEAASWPRVVFSPGRDPLGELAVRIAPLAGIDAAALRDRLVSDPSGFALTARQAAQSGAPTAKTGAAADLASRPVDAQRRRVLLVVDQCEELFTLCESPAEREAFVAALHAAGGGPHPVALIVIVIRADFEARLADFPELNAAVQDRYLLTAMTTRQLRLAITRPAAAAGTQIGEDLVRALLDEVRAAAGSGEQGEASGPGGHGGAGVLPLLSHALDQTWRNGTGGTLTLTDYERTRGIEGAVATSAQRAYDSLTPPQQEAARLVFTRLTAARDDGTDTAARVSRADLTGPGVEAVLERFAAERLLTLDADTVEITHEALLTAWPLLRDTWLADARSDRAARTRLRATASEWDQASRDPSYLYQGSRLDAAQTAAARMTADPRQAPLSRVEADFLRASHRVGRHRTRTRRQMTALLLALIAGLTAVVIVAVRAGQATASQRDIAASRLLINESESAGVDKATASDLEAVAAWSLDRSPQAWAAMLSDAASPEIRTITTGSASVEAVAVSSDGTIATAGPDGPVQLWDLATGRETSGPIRLAGGASDYLPPDVGFSSNGRTLVTYDTTAQRWNASSGREIGNPVSNIPNPERADPAPPGSQTEALSPDGKTLALTASGTLRLRDVATGGPIGHPVPLLTSSATTQGSFVAFSHDGKTVATNAGGQSIQLWAMPPEHPISTFTTADPNGYVAAAFSRDGKTLATLDTDGGVQLWSLGTGKKMAGSLVGAGTVQSMAFSPVSNTLATGDADGTIRLWNASTGQQEGVPLGTNGGGGAINSIAFSSDGTTMVTGTAHGTVQLWQVITGPQLAVQSPVQPTYINWAAFSGNARLITYGNAALRWNTTTGKQIGEPFANVGPSGYFGSAVSLPTISLPSVTPAVLSPNGKVLATISANETVQEWNTATGQPIGSPLRIGTADELLPVAFSPDSDTLLAYALADGSINGQRLVDLATGIARPAVKGAFAFMPNGDLLALSASSSINATSGQVQAWNAVTGKQVGRSFTVQTYEGRYIALSPDGTTLAISYGDSVVQLWNVATGQPVSTLTQVNAATMAFSPDSHVLVTVTNNGNVQAWSVATGQQIGSSLPGTPNTVVAFSPNGKDMAITNNGGTVQLWNVSYLADPLKKLCQRIDGTLTPQEWVQYVPPGPAYRNPCASAT
jgi:WD40 repeat protein/DNA-binding SARP family transcriptional activator